MKLKTITQAATCAFLLLVSLSSASGQVTYGGEVVGLLDARTVQVATPTGRVTVELQHIEVPETEQPLHATAKDHLKKLLLGKMVKFHFKQVLLDGGLAVGQVLLDGVDISRQMLRDGAAWHVPRSVTAQNEAEFALYAESESLAKREKRGVWSLADLKPAWEFRAARAASQKAAADAAAAANQPPKEEPRYLKNYKYLKPNSDMWVEVGGVHLTQKMTIGDGLFSGYDYPKKIANISTAGINPTLSNGQESLEIEMRFVYFYRDEKAARESVAYVMGIRAKSKKHNFSDSAPLVFICDGRQIDFGTAARFFRETDKDVEEVLQYKVTRDRYAAVAAAKQVSVKVGSFTGTVSQDSLKYLRNLVAASK